MQPTVTSGNTYVVPAEGAKVISWSTNATSGVGQILTLKIYRQVSGTTYIVVGHDGPRDLTPSAVNTFPANISVKPGDVLGLDDTFGPGSSSADSACIFSAPGDSYLSSSTALGDGQSATFTSHPNDRVNATALIAIKPSDNSFSFGHITHNKNNGTATLAVNVPGPGTLSLRGKGVKPQRTDRAARAVVSKAVSAAGTVRLKISARRRKKRKLENTGEVKVLAHVTYTPIGDVVGDPNERPKRVKLVEHD